MSLTIVPIGFRAANAFVALHHRHRGIVRGQKFALAVATDEGTIVGVAQVGRPIARHLDDGMTLEVNRTCTDGHPHANSALYAAAWRVARGLGYRRLLTYTQAGETGASLRAAGWRVIAERPARSSWAEATADERLRLMRLGSDDAGGVQRTLWEAV